MKLTPARKKFLTFMSGQYGRVIRGAIGISLVIVALLGMGWSLLLLIPAAFMMWTAVVNYCPATLFVPSFKAETNIIAKMPTYKLK
jgi:hypothetical protein